MNTYKLSSDDSVVRLADGASIPNDPENIDWQAYQLWLSQGNAPDPQFSPDELAAQQLASAKADLAARNAKCVAQIARIQDRIDTLGYGIDSGEATPEDEAEQAALTVNIKLWKTYKFALGKVTAQATWPAAPVWPPEPATPTIDAAPQARAAETA